MPEKVVKIPEGTRAYSLVTISQDEITYNTPEQLERVIVLKAEDLVQALRARLVENGVLREDAP